jgi:hypothetical protein
MSEMMAARNASSERSKGLIRALLLGGAVGGPLYLVVGLTEAFTRPGFDIRRHDLSLLANGDLGWIHIADLVVTGLLVVAGAVGMHRSLATGPSGRWGPLLVGVYGIGLIGGGFFTADPALGFPPGTPADAHAISWHGLMHFVSAAIGFLSLIAGCLVFARRFVAAGERAWAAYSAVTGVVFYLAFAGVAAGPGNGWTILGFWIGVVLAFSWITAMSLRLLGHAGAPGVRFTATVQLSGRTTIGIQVPAEVVDGLGPSRRPAVRVTINGYTCQSTVAPMRGEFMLPVSAEVRERASVAAGDRVEVQVELDTEPAR